MKPIAYIVCLLLLSHNTFSQSGRELHQIKPNWKLGDQKRVHTVSLSRIFLKDSLLNNTEAKGIYNIQVIDTLKNFTLSFSNEPRSVDIETTSSAPNLDSVANYLNEIIRKIEKETTAFKYELLVDKNTGQAFQVKNGDKLLKMIEVAAFSIIDELGAKKATANTQTDSMKMKVIAYFKLAEPKILETAINEFNYLMQAYTYRFPYNSTISQKTMVHDVNALGEFGGIEMPAVLTITSNQTNSSLTIQTDTDYDKDFVLGQIKKKHKNTSELTTSDIFLSEKTEAIFATTNSWMVSHKSNVEFKMKDIRVINETIVSLQ